ncbi:L,D-transpeptidase family protein [Paenibacillus apii]|uniref:L,D-transpeptidase family protein n=1 Tax=Paenibacillus apii TaxID=1850370 RepID=UPI0014387D9D|nr:L,D-transpeptidase family protein [Paenibacillus apii]NJJ39001.1 L,D-transpeptidase family protein [Paenibacillus apii]
MFMHKMLLILHLFILSNPVTTAEPPQNQEKISINIDPLKHQLYLYSNSQLIKKYTIALGKPETPSPVGEYVVINKYKNWGKGFGTRWIGLNVPWGTYGIHGTNRPYSIGHNASHGCIRMHNHDVEELYEFVRVGTRISFGGHVLGKLSENPRSLAKGDSGGDVQIIQYRLRSAGFYNGECNGKFNSTTELALKNYEKKHGLPVDGVAGYHDYLHLGLVE